MDSLSRSTMLSVLYLLCSCCVLTIQAWAPVIPTLLPFRPALFYDLSLPTNAIVVWSGLNLGQRKSQIGVLYAFGGFGGGGGGKRDDKKLKETKLKPKQQWDRYMSLKKENKIRVAVRVSEGDEWLEVGNVKSKENKYTEFAVARQRALIAEHARRLFPLRISPRDSVVWAFWNDESDQWTIVSKETLDKSKKEPAGLEKLIGFEGRPDPSSGFYCLYNEGRLVNDGDDSRPSVKRFK